MNGVRTTQRVRVAAAERRVPHESSVCAATCVAIGPDDEVDIVIVGCGAGGSVLAQRLARQGWDVVVARRRAVLGSRQGLGQ